MNLKNTVEGTLAGKTAGQPQFQNALVGGKEQFPGQVQAQKVHILGKAGVQPAGKYMGKVVLADP